ncbi:cytochrome C oxidase subunit IV family protein [Zunongwangia pacifica]|uniref:Cytochrome C oxidase subunit IV family protein n=1 Tax=Zunongwangia pacifica TaxID=2911062 RepID=A0A9X1ZSD7_9FLAO|nr:cytochrome C oxidase subunit IV family protein [Zunongwangia pacifica]MCL6216803.1 cytochrome C oxidase subunit IV family protein [Zunongwangia pacifica]
MAHDSTATHQHESNTKRIWQVFAILSVVTIVEVILGIVRPGFLTETSLVGMHLLNWIFIILTLYKAYYIAWAFMHMEHETKGLRRAVVWTGIFLAIYLIFILLTEGDYIYEVYKNGYIAWDF